MHEHITDGIVEDAELASIVLRLQLHELHVPLDFIFGREKFLGDVGRRFLLLAQICAMFFGSFSDRDYLMVFMTVA